MKISALMILLFTLPLANGCSHFQPQAKQAKPAPPSAPTVPAIVTPDNSLTAKVVSYNAAGRFVVLGFPVGQMPKAGQSLFLYRNGLKVSEVKVNPMSSDNFVVADLVSGNAQVGDEVRNQ